MNKTFLRSSGAIVLLFLIGQGCERTPGAIVHLESVGSNHIPGISDGIECPPVSNSVLKPKVFTLYITKKMLTNHSNGGSCNTPDGRSFSSCVTVADAIVADQNTGGLDDIAPNAKETGQAPVAAETNQQTEWNTRLDMILYGSWGEDSNQANSLPVIIKVVLGPGISFLRHISDSRTDSEYAIRQGDTGKGMFDCPSMLRSEESNGPLNVVTVRAHHWIAVTNGKPIKVKTGGLNIGILVHEDSDLNDQTPDDPTKFYMPMYIDPKMRNNG